MAYNKELESIYKNKFTFRVEDRDNISVLGGGYTITPSGDFVNVNDGEDHSSIFSAYLRAYLEDSNRLEKDSLHAMIHLAKLNHIVYSGIKLGDNVVEGNLNQGYALLLFPDNLSILTDEQKKSCLDFFSTNKSIFSDRKKVELQIHNFRGDEFTEDQLVERFKQELAMGYKRTK